MMRRKKKAQIEAVVNLMKMCGEGFASLDTPDARSTMLVAMGVANALEWSIGKGTGKPFETLLLHLAFNCQELGGIVNNKTGKPVDVLRALALGDDQ